VPFHILVFIADEYLPSRLMPGTEAKGDDGWGYTPVENNMSEGMPTDTYRMFIERLLLNLLIFSW